MQEGNVAPFLGGLITGMALLVLAWFLVYDPQPDSADGVGSARLSGAAPSASVRPSPGLDQLDSCVQAAARVQGPLKRAAASLDQWEVHVGAMNQLVVGNITLSQATAFWNRTRVGADRRIAQYESAMRQWHRHGVDCPAPDMLPSGASSQVRSCARRITADVQVLRAADTAIRTWHHHVMAMEMLRMGTLSPTAATQMWLSMWQRGQHEIDAYRSAVATARQTHACPSPDSRSASASPGT